MSEKGGEESRERTLRTRCHFADAISGDHNALPLGTTLLLQARAVYVPDKTTFDYCLGDTPLPVLLCHPVLGMPLLCPLPLHTEW